ncbi:MAG: TerB family tellurite resistance protein [Planctomycetes bacterium]|nr:TerB family tellurite resistance protein [Planctomycetota bacterium]
MADWRKLAAEAFLADGVIDNREVKILEKELYADGVIDKQEREFLIDLRNRSKKPNPAFTRFFFKAIKAHVLQDGVIDAAEARWLREMLFADGQIDADEKKFLRELKREAQKVSPAFETLYQECLGK